MAQVLTSISGLPISAASAGYAPTNSGDVSAIASGYQVVSSTATQLYAGTAFLTEVNGATVSASRAGQAANASMANSAYYDGTGRLISSLPDSAAVSSIASSYAESAVSGVVDTVSSNSASWASGVSLPITGSAGDDTVSYGETSVRFTRYDTAGEPDIRTAELSPERFYIDYTLDGNDHTSMTLNESMLNFTLPDGDRWVDAYAIDTWNSAVDTVANNSATWGAGVDSATVSAIASAYQVVSSVGDDGTYITSINGSALSGVGGGGATGDYVEKSAQDVAIGSYNTAQIFAFAQGALNSAYDYSFAQGTGNSASSRSFAQGYNCRASQTSLAQGQGATASKNSFAQGYRVSATNTATVFGRCNLHGDGDTVAFAIGDGTNPTKRHDLMLVTKDGEITMYSSTADTVGTGIMSSLRAISAAATGGVSLPITGTSGDVSGSYDASSIMFTRYDTAGEPDIRTAILTPDSLWMDYTLDGNDHTSMTLNESMLNFTLPDGDRYVDAYSIDTWNSAVDTVANNSATWGQGGVDSATVSSIASSYAESAVSSKLDSSASSSFYTTANESGFVDSAYVDSAVSGKMDSSAIDYTRTGGGTQIYASGTGSSTNQFSAKNDSAGAAIIAGENARLRLWDTAATANLYASSIGGWNAASNLVSSQSANWGGSALALSAGAGISLTMVGNTLVISTAGSSPAPDPGYDGENG